MEELPGDSRPPLRFSPSMIAGLRANDEPVAHAWLGPDSQPASKVRWKVTCELMASAFSRASFYTPSSASESPLEQVGEERDPFVLVVTADNQHKGIPHNA
jgi:hypothetical protein